MFCPKCKSLLKPAMEGKKRVFVCGNCGHKSDITEARLTEKFDKIEKKVEVVDNNNDDIHPMTDEECPQCGHRKAYYWTIQTRAGDEAETKFLKCEKCKHTWRDYG